MAAKSTAAKSKKAGTRSTLAKQRTVAKRRTVAKQRTVAKKGTAARTAAVAKKGAAAKAGAAAKRGAAVKSLAAKGTAAKAPAAKSAASKGSAAAKKRAPARAASGGSAARAAAPASEAKVLGEGDRAPSFELPDQAGKKLSSAELAGQPYVLYFYPKDDTPGCTTEACGFRDALPAFERLGVRVLGVSPDSTASHERFRNKYSLPFTLLSDTDKELATAYGVWALKKNYGREYMGVVRSTFLVGPDGVIRKAWRNVKVNGHVDQVQAAAAELG